MLRASTTNGRDRRLGEMGRVFVLGLPKAGGVPDYVEQLRADVVITLCDDVTDARRVICESDPFAGLVHLSECLNQPRVEEIETLFDLRPSLRLIAIAGRGDGCANCLSTYVKRGVLYDYHTLPVNFGNLRFSLGHIQGLTAFEHMREAASVMPQSPQEPYMIGASPAMAEIYRAIRKVAVTAEPVMITGETGTGKELAARAIHERSSHARGPFVAVNCAGLTPTLIASELFGHEKGSFTGAHARKIGHLEAAQNGTCFLDEIGDLPLELQGNLLRFLQEKVIERVGSTQSVPVNARVIAATNVDLRQAVREGRFREDLFYRLNVLSIHMPPLRDRGDDIELMATFFLKAFAKDLSRPMLGFRQSAMRAMRNYPWTGNVRELISVVRRASVMSEHRWLSAADLGLPDTPATQGPLLTLAQARKRAEDSLIRSVLASRPTLQAAATTLGVSRVTLYRLMEKYSISVTKPDSKLAKSRGQFDPK
jgi:DNA-binding NtrC family response regulator